MIVVIASLVLAAAAVVVTRHGANDGVAALVMRELAGPVPSAERTWISAMLAEHDSIDDARLRRAFARGCLRAMLFSRCEPDRTATLIGGVIGVAALGAAGLAAAGLVRYPGLREGWLWIVVATVFVFAVAGYAVIGLWLSQLGSAATRRIGLMAAVPAVVIGWWAGHSNGVVSSATLILLAIPVALVGAGVARSERHTDEAGVAVGCAAVAAGLFTFVAYASTTFITGGGQATASSLQQFTQSGASSYRAWAIGDHLDGAVFLLLFVPLVAGALGMLSAHLAAPSSSSAVSQTLE